MSRRFTEIVFYLPDIAILTMAVVITISLSLIGRPDLASLILLPLAIFLGLFWFKEHRDKVGKTTHHEQVKNDK